VGASPGGGTVGSTVATGTVAVPVSPNAPAASDKSPNDTSAAPESRGMAQAANAGGGSTPDHAVLMMTITKDELRMAPEFRTPR
jgi:hypothetical protein